MTQAQEAQIILTFIVGVSLVSLGYAGWLARWVLKKDMGTPRMQEISNAIKEGAVAFLNRQYKTIISLAVLTALIIVGIYLGVQHDSGLAVKTGIAFIFGSFSSALAGYVGMHIAIRSNVRTAAASTRSLDEALKVSLRGGAVSGITIVAMSLLGISILFLLYGGLSNPTHVPYMIVGYGFGASFVALFAQLGGGIYTKAADVGADLVGKVEAGIPEDDPRNPAVIADLVGDNVGDCAGRGADLFESTAAENIGAMILGIALYQHFGINGILFPLLARAFGLIAAMFGVLVVKTKEDGEPMQALNKGYYLTSILAAVGFWAATDLLLNNNMWFFYAGLVGIVTSILFVFITQYYTEYRYRPVKEIAESAKTGPATVIITGFAVALENTVLPAIVIGIALIMSYYFGLKGSALEFANNPAGGAIIGGGFFGTAIATMGMLSTSAYILAMDTFGPITDNAGGIIEMSDQPEAIRKKTDKLDAVGNTTKALTKGYAVGSAALAAFLLFNAYLDDVGELMQKSKDFIGQTAQHIYDKAHTVNLADVHVFVAGLLGAMLVFIFASLAIAAVGKAAYSVISDVRAQFKENPGIMKGTSKPNYGRTVDIVTKTALKKMVLPGILPILSPILVGLIFREFGFGAQAVAGFIMVATIVGVLFAIVLNNGGGAWDNAKKYVETGALGGKGSDAHKAAVVGDTVGDPFKDTAGPSLHVLIKLLATVTLVMAPLFL
ncbi:MAG: sodium-translocating pyrophosphatase [Deltaproteobacteria bacterium]|nr:sodium-translocating pyrophosphatase [Deltaproteobacteria bacterium]MCL5277743.1 sodium-translocating pyrophosphatase [Deltaproteobacteria bacterium]